jgi:hypothetical protein
VPKEDGHHYTIVMCHRRRWTQAKR